MSLLLSRSSFARRVSRGFTLIEILIVVVILGILAGIVIPQVGSASREAREAMLRDDLRSLRHQIEIFRLNHKDVPPGYPGCNVTNTPDADTFEQHLTNYTDIFGTTNATYSSTFRYGPYMSRIPDNPLSQKNGVWIASGSTMPIPDESQPYGWIYNPLTMRMIPNLSGTDLKTDPFTSY